MDVDRKLKLEELVSLSPIDVGLEPDHVTTVCPNGWRHAVDRDLDIDLALVQVHRCTERGSDRPILEDPDTLEWQVTLFLQVERLDLPGIVVVGNVIHNDKSTRLTGSDEFSLGGEVDERGDPAALDCKLDSRARELGDVAGDLSGTGSSGKCREVSSDRDDLSLGVFALDNEVTGFVLLAVLVTQRSEHVVSLAWDGNDFSSSLTWQGVDGEQRAVAHLGDVAQIGSRGGVEDLVSGLDGLVEILGDPVVLGLSVFVDL